MRIKCNKKFLIIKLEYVEIIFNNSNLVHPQMYRTMKKTPNTILMKFPRSFPLFFNQQKSRKEKKNKRIKMKH